MIKLANIDLSQFGFIEGKMPNSNIAYSGILDMPARTGKTFHSWPERKGIQPYVNANEIRFGGRDIKVSGYIIGEDRKDVRLKAKALYDQIDSFNDLVDLTCKWGIYKVYVNSSIKPEKVGRRHFKIELSFREPVVDLSGTLPSENYPDNDFGIDGISFKDLGGVMLELSGDRVSRTAPKAQQFTAYFHEGYQITKTEAPELSLKLYIKQPDYASFNGKIQSLYALFSSPGLRSLILQNDALRSFFVKDGFTVDTLYSYENQFVGIVNAKLTQVGDSAYNWSYLSDHLSNLITDNRNNKIIIRL
jgi:hypothetical protein